MKNRSPWPLCQVNALIAQQKMVAEQRPSSEAALREGVNCADSMTAFPLSPSFAVSVYPSALLLLFLLLNDSLYFLLNP